MGLAERGAGCRKASNSEMLPFGEGSLGALLGWGGSLTSWETTRHTALCKGGQCQGPRLPLLSVFELPPPTLGPTKI